MTRRWRATCYRKLARSVLSVRRKNSREASAPVRASRMKGFVSTCSERPRVLLLLRAASGATVVTRELNGSQKRHCCGRCPLMISRDRRHFGACRTPMPRFLVLRSWIHMMRFLGQVEEHYASPPMTANKSPPEQYILDSNRRQPRSSHGNELDGDAELRRKRRMQPPKPALWAGPGHWTPQICSRVIDKNHMAFPGQGP